MEKPHGLPVSDADWQSTPPAVQAQVVWQLQAVQQLTDQVLQLQQQVAQLQQSRGGSGGSGGAPGAAKPEGDTGRSRSRKRSRRRRSSGKKPGAQPGHEGHGRSLLPVAQVDDVVPIRPSSCGHCGHGLAGVDPRRPAT